MNVLLISDDNYAFLLGGCLTSLLKSNSDVEEINVYIIADHISDASIEKIKDIGRKYGRLIVFLDPPHMNDKLVVKGSLNISTYYRLMLSSSVPQTVDKLIYLDCDVLIRGSLKELWDTNISDYLIAGVYDTTGKYAREAVGLKKDEKYVNAGVLLINLKKWRDQQVEKECLDYLAEQNWKVEFNDQGVINHVCSAKTYLFSPKYNYMPTYERYTWRQLSWLVNSDMFCSCESLRESKKNPIIIHFAGYAFSRPWYEGVNIPYGEELINCINESGIIYKKQMQPTNAKYIIRSYISKMPNTICLFFNKLIDSAYVISEKARRGIK